MIRLRNRYGGRSRVRPPSAPVLLSGVCEGTKLRLAFSEPVHGTAEGDNGFTLRENGLGLTINSFTRVDGNVLVFSCDSPGVGNPLTIEYTPGVLDSDRGVAVAAIPERSIKNSTK